MKMMLVNKNDVVSHWTCVALISNSAIMVGKAVISKNWLNVNRKAAAIMTATTPFDSTFSFAISITLTDLCLTTTLFHTGKPWSMLS